MANKRPKVKVSQISIRVSPEEKEMIKEKADEQGMSISEYITKCALNSISDKSDNLEREISKLSQKVDEIIKSLREKND